MFKTIGNIASVLKNMGSIRGRMAEIQDELANEKVIGSAGGGMVTVECTGQPKIVNIKVDPTILSSHDAEMLEDLLMSAINQSLDKSRQLAAEKMAEAAGDMNLPGLGDALAQMQGGTQ